MGGLAPISPFNTSPSINIYLDAKREIECVNIDCCKFPNKESCRWEEESVNKSFDLKAWYGEAVIEKKYARSNEEFIADILCPCKKEGQDPLFIEISTKNGNKENKYCKARNEVYMLSKWRMEFY